MKKLFSSLLSFLSPSTIFLSFIFLSFSLFCISSLLTFFTFIPPFARYSRSFHSFNVRLHSHEPFACFPLDGEIALDLSSRYRSSIHAIRLTATLAKPLYTFYRISCLGQLFIFSPNSITLTLLRRAHIHSCLRPGIITVSSPSTSIRLKHISLSRLTQLEGLGHPPRLSAGSSSSLFRSYSHLSIGRFSFLNPLLPYLRSIPANNVFDRLP